MIRGGQAEIERARPDKGRELKGKRLAGVGQLENIPDEGDETARGCGNIAHWVKMI